MCDAVERCVLCYFCIYDTQCLQLLLYIMSACCVWNRGWTGREFCRPDPDSSRIWVFKCDVTLLGLSESWQSVTRYTMTLLWNHQATITGLYSAIRLYITYLHTDHWAVDTTKLENVAIAGHCKLRPPGLPPAPSPGAPYRKNCHPCKLQLVLTKCV